MANAHDVAAYVLERSGSMTAMKLQKLVYYSQAWHLVWEEAPLFEERIEAWANGPVVRELFNMHRGRFVVDAPWPSGSPSNLSQYERESIDAIIGSYGMKSGRDLSALTHAEEPWRQARAGLPPTASSNAEITHASMAVYYGGLDASEDAQDVSEWELDPFSDEPF
jgi:uncharacterized phage-associated protein